MVVNKYLEHQFLFPTSTQNISTKIDQLLLYSLLHFQGSGIIISILSIISGKRDREWEGLDIPDAFQAALELTGHFIPQSVSLIEKALTGCDSEPLSVITLNTPQYDQLLHMPVMEETED